MDDYEKGPNGQAQKLISHIEGPSKAWRVVNLVDMVCLAESCVKMVLAGNCVGESVFYDSKHACRNLLLAVGQAKKSGASSTHTRRLLQVFHQASLPAFFDPAWEDFVAVHGSNANSSCPLLLRTCIISCQLVEPIAVFLFSRLNHVSFSTDFSPLSDAWYLDAFMLTNERACPTSSSSACVDGPEFGHYSVKSITTLTHQRNTFVVLEYSKVHILCDLLPENLNLPTGLSRGYAMNHRRVGSLGVCMIPIQYLLGLLHS
ncbi:uncharacterized protein MYCFIDRAFT_171641 [Pseudocercospora fijiensis CIRAD86]|uniref:Uncharacterized protein n=1 Tax=Pseudocercospora fijiensis (strain CIRAD86) TaxID=383855 RepID=M3B8W5_PSEFD|nr:uncharacterized protein MYCFIDRAFT_171641 [Pseudocercospora fijiensis CIRAD86]EME85762.1 hypothetical protein MYCFIDRAFT_171641 [Pseudocercospora fijiensis CIRAD86]